MKHIDQCTTVFELLEDPKRWTKGASSRNFYGVWSFPESQHAVCWCFSGAIQRIYHHDPSTILRICNKVEKYLDNQITVYNDDPTRTHAEVLEVAKTLGI